MRLALEVNQSQLRRLLAGLRRAQPREDADKIVGRALLSLAYRVQEIAPRAYMSGPRPQRIDVVTGTLRRSIAVDRGRLPFEVAVGSNVVYAPVHEFGSRNGRIPARPYLQPALRDVGPEMPRAILTAWRAHAKSKGAA